MSIPSGLKFGAPSELGYSLRDLIGVSLLLIGVFKKFLRHRLRVDAFRHVVVALVPENAHNFGRERLVEDPDDRFPVPPVVRRHCTFHNLLTRAPSNLFDIC